MQKFKLINIRKQRGFSQEYLANVLNMDTSCYNRRENGHRKITEKEWQILAKALDVPLEDIYEADDNLTIIFKDNSSGNGYGYGNIVNNYSFPPDILDMLKKGVSALDKQVHYLEELLKKSEKE